MTGTRYDRAVLVDVLVYHQPTNTSGCICGWGVLGKSHPEHVAAMYETAMAGRALLDAAPAGCPNDPDGDGDCGRPLCPHCAPPPTPHMAS